MILKTCIHNLDSEKIFTTSLFGIDKLELIKTSLFCIG